MFKVLPPHLAAMALFAVNAGCRDGEVCALRWEWEVKDRAPTASLAHPSLTYYVEDV